MAVYMKVFCFILAAACLFACKTPKDSKVEAAIDDAVVSIVNEKPQLNEQILGTWTWWKTDCCSRLPGTTYAKDVQYERTKVFSKGGTVETFHNDTLMQKGSYEVYYGLMKDDDRPVLKIDNRPALLYINGDTLVIDFGYMDLQTDYYLRKK